MIKMGLLTGKSLTDFNLNTLKPIMNDANMFIMVAVIDARPEKSSFQKLKKNLRRRRGGYVIIMAIKSIFSKETGTATKTFCQKHAIDIIETKKPYAVNTIENIKKYDLDLLVLLGGYGIIRGPLLNITPLGVLSYHHGNMRTYRGMPPALWELYNNEKEMGVTVQILTPGLDCGTPLEEKTIEIKKEDTLKSLENRAYDRSTGMLHSAIKKIMDKNFEPEKIEEFGKVYTLPNLRQWITLQFKIAWRRLNR